MPSTTSLMLTMIVMHPFSRARKQAPLYGRFQTSATRARKSGGGRLRGPVGSLVLHLLPLLLLIDWPMSPPAEIEPIPVQLVFEPPPKAAPAPPQPQQKPSSAAASRPCRVGGSRGPRSQGGRQAARATRRRPNKPAKTETPPTETKPPEKPQQVAAMAPPPLPPAKSDAPKPDPVPKPAPKPTPAAHRIPRQVEEPGNLAPRRGRFPARRQPATNTSPICIR